MGKQPELWDPLTGETRAAALLEENSGLKNGPNREIPISQNGPQRLWVRLAPHGSLFVVLREGGAGRVQAKASGKNWMEPREVLNMAGPWEVTFDPAMSGMDKPVAFPDLASWSGREEPGIRFYSGAAVYAKFFDWEKPAPEGRVWLDLGAVADVAEVSLNGKDCGVAWTPPFRIEITGKLRRGANALEVKVANTWANRLLGDRGLPPAQRKTWTNAPDRPENASLLPAGLLGPVKVLVSP